MKSPSAQLKLQELPSLVSIGIILVMQIQMSQHKWQLVCQWRSKNLKKNTVLQHHHLSPHLAPIASSTPSIKLQLLL